MSRSVAVDVRSILRMVLAGALTWCVLGLLPSAASAAFSQTDVNTSIEKGVEYLDGTQNANGSWGTSDPGAETALALGSYGVLDGNKFATLSPARRAIVQNGLAFLLGTQTADGSFDADGLKTYDTGTALIALSLTSDVPTTPAGAVATAIANARNYLVNNQEVPPNNGISCQTTGPSGSGLGGQNFCGGWDYNPSSFRSDESNTGFGLTGLDVTGGVPAAVASANAGWQRNVQQLTNNPGGFPARNDGGGAYEPGISSGDFSSNANDTGSLLFGFGYDNVPAADPAVQAALKFGTDVLDTYELNKATRTMIFHTGQDEDGSCVIGQGTCDWQFGTGEGGYHYSLFALTKGFSQYISPNLTDANNFYSKVVDLLLTDQQADGSWLPDLRDDGSQIASTGFSILALGKVGIPVFPITAKGTSITSTEGKSFSGTVATFTVPTTSTTTANYSASINWGDGTTTSGTVSGGSGSFTVAGTHTYAEEGSFTVKVTITDVNTPSNQGSATTSATVGDAALHASGVKPKPNGKKVSGTVATFTDDNPNAPVSDFTVKINWGDGTTTTGTVSKSGSTFKINGTHTYSKNGTFTIKISIKDDGGSTASATDSVTFAAPKPHKKVVHGTAHLHGVPAACVLMPFNPSVTGTRIASVSWSLDGRGLNGKTVKKGKKYSSRVPVSTGKHHLTVKVKFVKASKTAAKTFHRTVSGCAVVAPKFTG